MKILPLKVKAMVLPFGDMAEYLIHCSVSLANSDDDIHRAIANDENLCNSFFILNTINEFLLKSVIITF